MSLFQKDSNASAPSRWREMSCGAHQTGTRTKLYGLCYEVEVPKLTRHVLHPALWPTALGLV